MSNPVAVFDLGKTNLKLVVVDERGRILETRHGDNAPLKGPPYPHADTERIWHWLLAALADVARNHPITAIIPTAHGSTAALVTKDGTLALPIMDYEAEPPDDVKDGYASVAPDFGEVFAPTNPACLTLGRQLFWQATEFADAFASARQILMYASWAEVGRVHA